MKWRVTCCGLVLYQGDNSTIAAHIYETAANGDPKDGHNPIIDSAPFGPIPTAHWGRQP